MSAMEYKLLRIFVFLVIVHVLSACKFEKQREGEAVSASKIDSSLESLQEELNILEDVLYLYPIPGEIIEGFFDAELEYKSGLVNSVEKKDSYLESRSQALNLGIYITDLAYSAKFGLTGEALGYLEAVYSLGTRVGVSTEVFQSLLDRAKENISDSDSIVHISNEAFYQMIFFLENSNKENTLAVISVGAYIESLYLVLETKELFIEDDPVFTQIGDMKYPLDNLLDRAKKLEGDKNVASIISYLISIHEIFDKLVVDETETAVSKKEGKLVINGGSTFNLNAENFMEMKSAIRSIRAEITTI